MDRKIIYPAQIPLVEDQLQAARFAQIAVARIAGALYGEGGIGASGLDCTPGSGLSVVVGPGSIVTPGVIDANAYGVLPADLSALPRQYILTGPVVLAVPSDGGAYVIYGTPETNDVNNVVLPFFNAANPSQTYAGYENSGEGQPTVRSDSISLGIGASAPEGSVPLWSVALPSGATNISTSMISPALGAPLFPSLDKIAARIVAPFNPNLAAAFKGYPKKSIVADPNLSGVYWVSTADDNLTTPGAEGATWVSLFSDYYTKAQSDAALAARTGRLIAVTSIITRGTSTWTPNPLTTRIVVEVLGGGGAGGGTEATSGSQQAVAWGGTGGDYAKSGLVPLAQISSPVTVTVGAGGAAVAGSDGGPGLTSSFGSYLTAPGGQGGYKGYANTVGQSIGADMPVSPDGSGSIMMLSQRGAGGGGPLALGTQITTRGGYGGRSFLGPGGGGTTGAGSAPNVGSFGGGGGGQAVGPSASNPLPGAAGGDGCVIIWEYA